MQKRVDEAIQNSLEQKGYKMVDKPEEAHMVPTRACTGHKYPSPLSEFSPESGRELPIPYPPPLVYQPFYSLSVLDYFE
ncbi:MAG: hypothetical protein P8Y60_06840 [Calditrichota bacterium]